jgi:hypothetical protein
LFIYYINEFLAFSLDSGLSFRYLINNVDKFLVCAQNTLL